MNWTAELHRPIPAIAWIFAAVSGLISHLVTSIFIRVFG